MQGYRVVIYILIGFMLLFFSGNTQTSRQERIESTYLKNDLDK